MSKVKEYQIKTLQDIIQCTNADNIDNFLLDLKNYLIIAHSIKELVKIAGRGDLTQDIINKGFVWMDDGKHESTVEF